MLACNRALILIKLLQRVSYRSFHFCVNIDMFVAVNPFGVALIVDPRGPDLAGLIDATSYSNAGATVAVLWACDRARLCSALAKLKMIGTATATNPAVFSNRFLRHLDISPNLRISEGLQ